MYLIRYSEIALKSEYVRREWEKRLIKNIRDLLCITDVRRERGRIWIDDNVFNPELLKRVFGIQSFSYCEECGLEDLEAFLLSYSQDLLKEKCSFALSVKRVGTHDFTSQDIAREMGAKILELLPHLKVDLTDPEAEIYIEIRAEKCYIFSEIIQGIGGLPLGVSGRLISLFSGKNSMIASFMMMKRGCEINPLFVKWEGDSGIIEEKIAEENIAILKSYLPGIYIKTVPFDGTKKPSLKQIYEVAEEMASGIGAKGIVTGECIACDSSGTFDNLRASEGGCNLPIYRPVVAFSREELDKMFECIST
ncbi:MAG: THUMP domain-containing protein [Halobacteriota archaeon]|nr:THUMP domain-containing protein [Halobacteriota archaeon]